MRTTVTLDPDVERLVRCCMRERRVCFKQALNEAIRSGLGSEKRPAENRFVQKSFPLGAEQHFRWDKTFALGENIEDEELSRKLSLRK